jgi:hypothetical protein
MFGTLFDKLQSLLSRSFLLSSFFPFLIFFVASAGMAYLGLPEWARDLTNTIKGWDAGSLTSAGVAGLIAIAIIGYIASPLTSAVRRILEGDALLTEYLRNELISSQRRERNRLIDIIVEARRGLSTARNQQMKSAKRLREARNVGIQLQSITNSGLIDSAEVALDNVAVWTPDRGDGGLQTAIDRLVEALEHNSSELEEDASSLRLGNVFDEAMRLLRDQEAAAHQHLDDVIAERERRFARAKILPTRLANVRAAAQSYSSDAYAIEFEYLWPRLVLALQKDEKISGALDTAKANVDFALLMVMLSFVFTVAWLSILAIFGTAPILVIILGLLGPCLVALFCLVVQESEHRLGELVRAAADLYRFDLLRALHLALPTSFSTERKLWERIQQANSSRGATDIDYKHEKP